MLHLDIDGTLTLVYIFLLTIRLDFNLFFNRFDPVLVETDLIYDNHDETSCWTVIVHITTGLRFCSGYYVDRTVYMLPALRRPAVFVPHIIWVCHLTGGLYALVFFVWVFFIPADCLFVFLFVFHTVILCFISVVLGGAGFLADGGEGVPFSSLVVSSGWSP